MFSKRVQLKVGTLEPLFQEPRVRGLRGEGSHPVGNTAWPVKLGPPSKTFDQSLVYLCYYLVNSHHRRQSIEFAGKFVREVEKVFSKQVRDETMERKATAERCHFRLGTVLKAKPDSTLLRIGNPYRLELDRGEHETITCVHLPRERNLNFKTSLTHRF